MTNRRLGEGAALPVAFVAALALASEAAAVPPCSWTLKTNQERGLAAGWLDTSSTGWVMDYVAVPGTRLVFRGAYAHSRFFVIDVYDARGNPYIPDFLDALLEPDPGSANPFTTAHVSGEQYYTARVEFTPEPLAPAANTIYAGTMTDGSTLNAGGTIALRVYLPDDPESLTGGVPLPDVTIEAADGTTLADLEPCQTPREGVPGQAQFSEILTNAAWPLPGPASVPFFLAQNPPRWSATTNPDLDSTLGGSLPTGPLPIRTGIGLLTTPNNSYISTRISREHGEVFVMRAKAPTSPDTGGGEWVGTPRQVRYWSVCEFSTTSGQSVACLPDHEIVRDDQGFFTFVISEPPRRPDNAPNWLPLGAYEGWPSIRQFLPAADFDEAVEHLEAGEDLAQAMGEYFPRSGYCSTADFEALGVECLSAP